MPNSKELPAAPTAIVLMIDQLSASMLGPYGNTMFDTPNFNRLAAGSLLLDFASANSVDLETAYDRFWQSPRSDRKADASKAAEARGLISLLGAAGIDCTLMTDEMVVANHRFADFDRIIPLDQETRPHSAKTAAETQMADFFALAASVLTDLEPGSLCWLHSRGLRGLWDAPYDFRRQLAGEEDPDPPRFVESPATWLDPATVDPDELLGLQQGAGGQIRLLDEFLGVILDLLDLHPLKDSTLLCLAANRGCPMGEHGLVGPGDQLFNESIQVPLMIRLPKAFRTDAFRSSSLVQVNRLSQWVHQWLLEPTDRFASDLNDLAAVFPDRSREWVLVSSPEQESLQTHAWKVVRSKMGGTQLFSKPDDRWEVNDVSDRCPDIVAKMLHFLDQLLADNRDPNELRLPNELAFGLF